MKFETYIALRYLTAKHRNRFINVVTLFSVGGILVGVGALVVVISIMNGFEEEVRSRIIDTTAHITVYSFRPEGIGDWASVAKRISALDGVVGVSPFVYEKGAIVGPKSSDGVMIRGASQALEGETSAVPDLVYWGDFELVDPDTGLPTAVLGRYLAAGIGAHPDDTVTILALRRGKKSLVSGKPVAKKFIVAGIFETGMYDYDATLCFIPLSCAQRLFGYGNFVSGIQVKTDNFYRASRTAKRIEERLGFPFYAVPWSETNKNLFSWMTLEKWGMFLVLALIIAVAAFNIVSTLMMVVMEKTTDIGVLKAMGARDGSIVRIFLLQGFVVGVAGTVLGAALGGAIVWVQRTFHVISLPPDVYSISSLPMQIRLWDVVAVVVLALGLSVLSAVYPAWRAAKLKPVDAIRYR